MDGLQAPKGYGNSIPESFGAINRSSKASISPLDPHCQPIGLERTEGVFKMQYRQRRQCTNRPPSCPRWMRPLALTTAATFAWSFVLATPVFALTSMTRSSRTGVRVLTPQQMQQILGSTSIPPSPGAPLPWQTQVHSVNTGNGNKLTAFPIVSWTARGGLPVNFTLYHNSQSSRNADFGQKCSHSFAIYLYAPASPGQSITTGNLTIHWGDETGYTFTQNLDGSYSPPAGIHDSLVQNWSEPHLPDRGLSQLLAGAPSP